MDLQNPLKRKLLTISFLLVTVFTHYIAGQNVVRYHLTMTDKEYMTGFKYITTRNIALSTHYDSDMGIGFGATFSY